MYDNVVDVEVVDVEGDDVLDDEVQEDEDEDDDVGGPIPRPRTILCANLRSRNARQDITRATLYRNLQVKYRAPEPRTTLCASLCSRNAR